MYRRGWPRGRGLASGGSGPSRARRRRDRPAPRPSPPGSPLRGRTPPADTASPSRRRARRHRARGGRRRADERARPARRLRGPEPVHDVGLQVRPARGGGEAPQARLAEPRSAAGARELGALLEPRDRPGSRRRAGRAARDPATGDRRDPDAAPAAGARRPRAQRRAHRRARRPARHHAGRAVQDTPRRTQEASAPPRGVRSLNETLLEEAR